MERIDIIQHRLLHFLRYQRRLIYINGVLIYIKSNANIIERMSTYNGCTPDPSNTLGDPQLIGRLLVALNVAVFIWGTLAVYQYTTPSKLQFKPQRESE